MFVYSIANTTPLHLSRAVILWILAFLIGPWPAVSCIIHCLVITPSSAGVEHFLCDAPHTGNHHETPPPPVRYELWSSALVLVSGGLLIVQRFVNTLPVIVSSAVYTPDPPPPRMTLS
ncbi:MAG: hypothetical protein C0184_05755 [Chloroflexus aggregans]|uniref:Uncharacterized protein n=1 Tax=Chloroflexus aggregans TaxID=152260 RepID=A0A2J6X7Q0_9CHLR|nr:MAG: hypothetical protein C0184_05755 [Chloroflexus aggregans]